MSNYWLDAPRCQHLKDDGIRCGSPALRGQPFCYNHHQAHHPRHRIGDADYQIPVLESQKSVELAIRQVLQAYHDKKIDDLRARTMIYGIQVLAPYACRNQQPVANYVATELPPAMQQLSSAGVPPAVARASSPAPAAPESFVADALIQAPSSITSNQSPISNSPTFHIDVDSMPLPPEKRNAIRQHLVATYDTEHPKLTLDQLKRSAGVSPTVARASSPAPAAPAPEPFVADSLIHAPSSITNNQSPISNASRKPPQPAVTTDDFTRLIDTSPSNPLLTPEKEKQLQRLLHTDLRRVAGTK